MLDDLRRSFAPPASTVARVLEIIEAKKAIPVYDDIAAAIDRLAQDKGLRSSAEPGSAVGHPN
jgi:hypothetical protein